MLEETVQKPEGIREAISALLKTRKISVEEGKEKGEGKCVLHKDDPGCFCTVSMLSKVTCRRRRHSTAPPALLELSGLSTTKHPQGALIKAEQ